MKTVCVLIVRCPSIDHGATVGYTTLSFLTLYSHYIIIMDSYIQCLITWTTHPSQPLTCWTND